MCNKFRAMGVTVRINGYKQDQSYIVGKIKCLGYYEVKLGVIEKFKIRKYPVEFFGDILLIVELENVKGLSEIGLHKNSYLFYHQATNFYSGQSLRNENEETIGLMFDPAFILRAIIRLLEAKDDLMKYYFDKSIIYMIEQRNEIENLKDLKSLLEETIQEDGIIGITIG